VSAVERGKGELSGPRGGGGGLKLKFRRGGVKKDAGEYSLRTAAAGCKRKGKGKMEESFLGEKKEGGFISIVSRRRDFSATLKDRIKNVSLQGERGLGDKKLSLLLGGGES